MLNVSDPSSLEKIDDRRENEPIDSFYLNLPREMRSLSIIRDLTDVSQSLSSLFSKDSLLEQ